MFWITTVLLIIFVFAYVTTFMIDPITKIYIKTQNADKAPIQEISEQYVESLGITINKPIRYKFVRFQHEERLNPRKPGPATVLLGMFHEWNGTYYIDISVNLYHIDDMLHEIVRHETRHMIVQELKNRKIIDLSKYTEEIAQENDQKYNNLFDESVKLLKEEQFNGK